DEVRAARQLDLAWSAGNNQAE
ncbi:hypothetical protein MNBD_GAMMA10-2401, partial [hydrothermal vent metagenome]